MRKFDYVIIGGGAAGLAAAIKAEALGVTTALIEQETVGGTVNLGSIPTKGLLRAGERGHYEAPVDFAVAMSQARRVMDTIRVQNYERPLAGLKNLTRFRGRARFAGSREIVVDDEGIQGNAFLIATGSVPHIPAIPGLDEVDYLTDNEFMEMTGAPRSLAIIGGGPLGLEFAQIFAHFGTKVMVIHRGSRILPEVEPEVAALAHAYLAAEGIDIRTGESPREVRWRGSGKEIVTQSAAGERRCECEEILPATGRLANIRGLGLEMIGVELDERGAIVVDDELRTNLPYIYAAGDVRGGPMVEPAAHREGTAATENALAGLGTFVDYEAIPNCVFIHPQVARVGMAEADAARRRHLVETQSLDYTEIPRAVVSGDTRGLIKMTVDKDTRRVLGCSIIGQNAGDMIHEVALAIKEKLTVDDLASLSHVYPTYSQAVGLVAERLVAALAPGRAIGRAGERAA